MAPECQARQTLPAGNPFIFNMTLDNRNGFLTFMSRWKNLIQYIPMSDLGKLFHAIGTQRPRDEIQEIFNSVNPIWQEKISTCSQAGLASQIALIESEDKEASSIACLSASVQMAVSLTFNELPTTQKDKVYDEIAAMNGISENCLEWGKEHAFDNILLFVDALEKTINPSE
jgi:hypothetical protein